MNKDKAERIEKLRCGPIVHSWRRISEIICEEYPDEDQALKGNQIHGRVLCEEAMWALYGSPSMDGFNDLPESIRYKWET